MSVKSLISKFEPGEDFGVKPRSITRKVSINSIFNPYADLSSSIPKTDPRLLETPCNGTAEILSINSKDDLSRIESIAKVRYSKRISSPEGSCFGGDNDKIEGSGDVYISWDEKLDSLSRKLSASVPTYRGESSHEKYGHDTEYFVDAHSITDNCVYSSTGSSVDKIDLPAIKVDSKDNTKKDEGYEDEDAAENIHNEKSVRDQLEAGSSMESLSTDTRIKPSKVVPQGIVFHKTAPLELIDEEIKTPEKSYITSFEPLNVLAGSYSTPTSCRTIAFNVDKSDPRRSRISDRFSFRSNISFNQSLGLATEENLDRINSDLFDNDVYQQLDTPITPHTDTFQPKEPKDLKVYRFDSSGSSIPNDKVETNSGSTASSPSIQTQNFPFLAHLIDEQPDAKKWYQNIFHFRPKKKSSRTISREEFQPIVLEEVDVPELKPRRYSKQSLLSKSSKDAKRREGRGSVQNTKVAHDRQSNSRTSERKISVDMIKTPHWVPRPPNAPHIYSNGSQLSNFSNKFMEPRQIPRVKNHPSSLDNGLLSPADLTADHAINRSEDVDSWNDTPNGSGSTNTLSNIDKSFQLQVPEKTKTKSPLGIKLSKRSVGTQTDFKIGKSNAEDEELKENFLDLRETIFQVFSPHQKQRFSTILDDIFNM
ncbi:hypothetical protein CLIB1444_03S08922 [[Candida] jaroonii]|uniref:Uncharacterized protein n=1 Tax=[Candida] jaroonii TaxID=467808 RepID=A0ACA9Y5L1_9ASCO|nr:hypothetical protein CLIB1444_03S08922 [[Candida] jaroonii]